MSTKVYIVAGQGRVQFVAPTLRAAREFKELNEVIIPWQLTKAIVKQVRSTATN
jgi:hypothetical protein